MKSVSGIDFLDLNQQKLSVCVIWSGSVEIEDNNRVMEKSMKYFSHYFQEIQTTKEKFRDYINRSEPEGERLIELADLKQDISEVEDIEVAGAREAADEGAEYGEDEKAALIARIEEMARTLDDISNKMADIKEETLRLRQENTVMDEYILNLMEQTKTFEPAKLS